MNEFSEQESVGERKGGCSRFVLGYSTLDDLPDLFS